MKAVPLDKWTTVKLQRLWEAPDVPMEVNGQPVYAVLDCIDWHMAIPEQFDGSSDG